MFSAVARLSFRGARPLALMLAASSACAGVGEPAQPGPLAWLPRDVDAAIHVHDAAGVRRSPAGRAVVGILTDLGTFERAEAAWRSLAETLTLEPSAAFDALLGKDAVLAIRWPELAGSAPPEWVLISRVSAETEGLIARRLALAPRELVARRHVLALEDGRFELAIDPRPPIAGAEPCARLVFAPAHASRLLEQTLANVADSSTGPTLADAPGVRRLDAEAADARVVIRTREGMPGWLRWSGRDGFVLGSFRADGGSATIEWTMSPSMIEASRSAAGEPGDAPERAVPASESTSSVPRLSSPQAIPGQRLAGGVIRPESWARAIVDRPLEDSPLRFAAWIEDLRWDVVLESAEVARGRAWIRFNARDAAGSPDAARARQP